MKQFLVAVLLTSVLTAPACSHTAPEHFTLSSQTEVRYDDSLSELADYMAEYLPVRPSIRTNKAYDVIHLRIDTLLVEEEFRVEVTSAGVEIAGGGYGGVFNGIQALMRMLPSEVYARNLTEDVPLQDTVVSDAPRFGYRGLMLDVARTWIGYDRLKRTIDLLAHHNINKLHLHLTDDEGWRVEIKSHPELTEVGGFRGEGSPVRAVYGKWGERYGGFYTQDEMRELIEYAAVRNVEIIPEIDLPGHSRNIALVHPAIRCNYPADLKSTHGYDYRSAWCAAKEENYQLLSEILSEICELFPSEYVHVGGDEVDMTQWKRCPDCQEMMRREGMTDPHELEDYFLHRVTEILQQHGKKPAVWNEAVTTAKFTRESRVYGWQNVKACLKATANGYPTVVMPGAHFYFDMRQSPHEVGHDWAGIVDARKTFAFDFEKAGFEAQNLKNVIGFEGAFWSEAYVSNTPETADYLDYMLFPRVNALAHLAWRGNDCGWEAFYKELTSEAYDRLEAMGVKFRLFPPVVKYVDGQLYVSVDDGSEIYYKEGGDESEHRYTRPIKTTRPHLYRFLSRRGTGVSPEVAHRSYYRMIQPEVVITSSIPESEQFPMKNASTYRGMTRTRRTCGQGDWILYTFTEAVRCREMYLQTGNLQLPKGIFTTGYAEVSVDGVNFERVGDLHQGSITIHPSERVKAVRLVSTCDDNGTPFVSIQSPKIKPIL